MKVRDAGHAFEPAGSPDFPGRCSWTSYFRSKDGRQKNFSVFHFSVISALLTAALLFVSNLATAGQYTNFSVAVYIPVSVVRHLGEGDNLPREWTRLSSQLKVDKVYIEAQRDRTLADDTLLERMKTFFTDKGVRVAGGMALSDGGSGQFRSFCYTDPK